MRRFLSILLACCTLLLAACSATNVQSGSQVKLVFKYADRNIEQILPEEEAAQIIRILDGKHYESSGGIPSCGFTGKVALVVNGRTYAVAMDTCNCLQDSLAFKYFSVSQDEIAYIHALFEKYGGFFPCI